MELEELLRRVLRRHALLLAVCVLAGIVAVVVVAARRVDVYAATTTLSVTGVTPSTSLQAEAPVDRLRAVVTTRAAITEALDVAGLGADPDKVGPEIVTVSGLGNSAVVRLTARQGSAVDAQRLADGLAVVAVRLLDPASGTGLASRLGGLMREEAALQKRAGALAAGRPLDAPPTPAQNSVQTSLGIVQSERVKLQSTEALLPRVVVLDRAGRPSAAVPTRLPLELSLGGLLGLAIGLAGATALETVRPGMSGLTSLAKALAVPSLGLLPGRLRGDDLMLVARRLRLLAAARGADTLVVVSLRPTTLLDALAVRLGAAVDEDTPPPSRVIRVGGLLRPGTGPAGGALVQTLTRAVSGVSPVRVCTLAELQPEMTSAAVAVLLTPTAARSAELDRVLGVCAASGVVLAGVVGFPRRLRRITNEPKVEVEG